MSEGIEGVRHDARIFKDTLDDDSDSDSDSADDSDDDDDDEPIDLEGKIHIFPWELILGDKAYIYLHQCLELTQARG